MSLKAFTITHWGHKGEGTGASVVVASGVMPALHLLKAYFDTKPEGYKQFQSLDLLEVEPHEDSTFGDEPVSTETSGVKLEYWFPPGKDTHLPKLIFVDEADKLAKQLDELQAKQNDGRGVECVRSVCFYLRHSDFNAAKRVAQYEGDKIRQYPEIVAVLQHVGFWYSFAAGKARWQRRNQLQDRRRG